MLARKGSGNRGQRKEEKKEVAIVFRDKTFNQKTPFLFQKIL
jgi:hypothetical protein